MTEFDFYRFGFDEIIKSSYTLEFWDISEFLSPGISEKIFNDHPFNIVKTKKFSQRREIALAISVENTETIAVFLPPPCSKTYEIILALVKNKIEFGFAGGSYGPPEKSPPKTMPLSLRLKRLTLQKFFFKLSNKFTAFRSPSANAAFLVIGAGIQSRLEGFLAGPETKIIWCHGLDYEKHLKSASKIPKKESYGVFLDQNLPSHNDYAFTDFKPPFAAEDYYKALNQFFDHIAKEHKIPIRIACHPRSNLEQTQKYFPSRQVAIGSTNELVQNSNCVFLHYSTSINYAIIHQKPFIFITTNEIEKSIHGPFVDAYAKYFQFKIYNISKDPKVSMDIDSPIDRTLYERFFADYIKAPNSPEKPFWTIFCDYLDLRNRDLA